MAAFGKAFPLSQRPVGIFVEAAFPKAAGPGKKYGDPPRLAADRILFLVA